MKIKLYRQLIVEVTDRGAGFRFTIDYDDQDALAFFVAGPAQLYSRSFGVVPVLPLWVEASREQGLRPRLRFIGPRFSARFLRHLIAYYTCRIAFWLNREEYEKTFDITRLEI